MNQNVIPDLSSRELQAICTIAEYRSFVAAALTLDVSQPALTRTLKRVEGVLGVELFRRSTRRVEVTPAGREFVAVASRILADLRISFTSMREIADEQRGQVIVSAVMSAACTRLPDMVAEYRSTRQGVEIQLREGVHGNVTDDVRGGIADFGISYVDDLPAEFSTIPLCQETFHVVMPRRHPLAQRDSVELHDLREVPLVSLPPEAQTRRILEACASIEGLSMMHAVTVTQFATAIRCVQAGVGLCVVPGGAIPAATSAGLVSRLLITPKLQRTLGLVTLQSRSLAPSARGLLGHIEVHWPRSSEPSQSDGATHRISRKRSPRKR